ncbi:MAG: electron transfer flavoprotein subunit alpha/FixB family protein [Chloroflexota bacterium]|nr:MAG: electron transfer flavoprotein subunit alpha/FixB family protein [Chloroflexota bacterium]
MATIWVFAELNQGRLMPITLELVSKARELGQVEVVALGPGAREAVAALGAHGATRVYLNEDPAFAEYLAEPAADALAALVARGAPAAILFGFSSDSRDVAGRLAARLDLGLISNASDLSGGEGGLVAKVGYFGGTKIASYRANNSPALVLIRPKSFEASESGGSAEVVEIDAAIGADSRRAKIVDRKVEAGDKIKLEDAKVVVSGGRGLQAAENYQLVEELAEALGGAAGASRAIVDAGWVPYSSQVGQTGKTVRPDVYVAVGISGAMQHTVGMKASKTIIAINKDPDAPILKMADLGVVGDALKILPKLTAEIRARR